MLKITQKNPEHYTCSLEEFDNIFLHTCLTEYRILDRYIVPPYVHKALEVPITLLYNLTKFAKTGSDDTRVQELLENVIEHIILHLPYIDSIPFDDLVKIWEEITIRYLKYKINFNDYLIYITFQYPDYEDDNYHCHIILFDLRPSIENNILLAAINKGLK